MPLTTWRKSSFSSDSDSNRGEVMFAVPGVAVRDAENAAGSVTAPGVEAWRAFTAATRS